MKGKHDWSILQLAAVFSAHTSRHLAAHQWAVWPLFLMWPETWSESFCLWPSGVHGGGGTTDPNSSDFWKHKEEHLELHSPDVQFQWFFPFIFDRLLSFHSYFLDNLSKKQKLTKECFVWICSWHVLKMRGQVLARVLFSNSAWDDMIPHLTFCSSCRQAKCDHQEISQHLIWKWFPLWHIHSIGCYDF